jgi:hypothetical protein
MPKKTPITESENYRIIRTGNSDISFSYFNNNVVVDMDSRELVINVDDHFVDMKFGGYAPPQGWKHPHIPLAGEVIVNPISEQLIAFCEADLKMPCASRMLCTLPSAAGNPTTDDELLYYKNYEELTAIAPDIINSCLYVNIFPPLVKSCSPKMFAGYFDYLSALQEEYQKLLEFCFSVDFYPKELDGITAATRFSMYCWTANMNPMRPMNMTFQFARFGFGNKMTPIRNSQIFEDVKANPPKGRNLSKKRELNDFELTYGISDHFLLDLARIQPVSICSSYVCKSLEEMLCLEFEKMLELDMRIKKCKNCRKYFILKGNYQTEYCDRIPAGETQNCQSIGAAAKYAQKVKENPALAVFNRAYKRYHARMKVNSVKPDAFKKWKYEAVVMRDRCLDGEVPVEEFEVWIDGYFEV